MVRRIWSPSMVCLWLAAISFPCGARAESSTPAGRLKVRAFGAKGDGVSKDTAAVQDAIDTCARSGGGTVHFSPGTYLCSSLHLRSGVTLWLAAGAIIKGSMENGDYDPYRCRTSAGLTAIVTALDSRHD